jgi:hypothetical protein
VTVPRHSVLPQLHGVTKSASMVCVAGAVAVADRSSGGQQAVQVLEHGDRVDVRRSAGRCVGDQLAHHRGVDQPAAEPRDDGAGA